MRALRPNDRQVDSNIILNLRKSSLSLLFVLKSFERGIYRKPLNATKRTPPSQASHSEISLCACGSANDMHFAPDCRPR